MDPNTDKKGITDDRAFQPVKVGTCYFQTADDRFGKGAREAIRERERSASYLFDESPYEWPESGGESDDEGTEGSMYRLVPTMLRYRNNLTALSQVYNLYLVAYHGQIFAYVPRNVPRQTIPRYPDARLSTCPTNVARRVGGYQDTQNPHTINHLIVGSLGREEIIVACFDDGDVVAYWTHKIVDWISNKPPRTSDTPFPAQTRRNAHRGSLPRPFLHENVGMSAWALAIHKKSRLIAVGSNRAELTVFAMGLTPKMKSKVKPVNCECRKGKCAHLESDVRQRARNWRIVVNLGWHANNIPNLCFVDDESGSAEMVCAIDIKGVTWLADIWKPFQAAIRIDPCNGEVSRDLEAEGWPALSRGWGILALPTDGFLRVDTVEELLGLASKDLQTIPGGTLNAVASLKNIPDNPCFTEPTPLISRVLPPHLQAHITNHPGLLEQFSDLLPHGWEELNEEQVNESETGIDQSLAAPHALVGEDTTSESEDEDEDDDEDEIEDEEDDDEDEGDESSDTDTDESTGGDNDEDDVLYAEQANPQPADTGFQLEDESSNDEELIPIHQLLLQALPAAGAYQPINTTTSGNPLGVNLDEAVTSLASQQKDTLVQSVDDRAWRENHDSTTSSDRLDMVYIPQSGLAMPVPQATKEVMDLFNSYANPPASLNRDPSVIEKLSRRYYLLRLYEKDVELRSLDQKTKGPTRECVILLPQAVIPGDYDISPLNNHLFYATTRLSMVAYLPDISLVVVGSPIGRVLLITPTELATPLQRGQGLLQHGFRVDWVLPRRSDEDLHRRVVRPLHGMAVAPVQESGSDLERHGDTGRGLAPRRYRLMLHYRSHDIITYEFTRETETGKLCIF